MTVFIVCAITLLFLLMLFRWGRHHTSTPVESQPSCATCDGHDSRCMQECAMEAAIKDIEYFDDEELDMFRDRQSDHYTDDEAEQFREVLYTMRQEEVRDWANSLALRHIEVPDQLKDELFLMMNNE